MYKRLIGIVDTDEKGEVGITLGAEQISRDGKTNDSAVDLLAHHVSLAGLTKRLKPDLGRTTAEDLVSKPVEGDEMDVNKDLHRGLATLQCSCGDSEYLRFQQAQVYETYSGAFSKTYVADVAYACSKCEKEYTKSGAFKKRGLRYLFD
jgi:hypothetical protein